MHLNQSFLLLIQISVHGCLYTASLHALLPLLISIIIIMLQMHNEGVYIPFPSCALKLSNLELNFYLPALTTLNVVYLLRMRAKGSRSDYNIQVPLLLMASFKIAQQSKGIFKICVGVCLTIFCLLRVGSLDVGDAPASLVILCRLIFRKC
jgi:hypothetical protein